MDTSELSKLEKTVRKLFSRAKATNYWVEYKIALTAYNKAIRKEKRASWRRHCLRIENIPECSRLQKALTCDNKNHLGSIRKPDGNYTEDEKELLKLTLHTHFPGSRITEERPTNPIPKYPKIRALRKDWKVASSVIDENKLVWAINGSII